MFVLRATLVRVEAREDVKVVAFDSWERLRMKIYLRQYMATTDNAGGEESVPGRTPRDQDMRFHPT